MAPKNSGKKGNTSVGKQTPHKAKAPSEEYLALIRTHPLKPIRSMSDLESAVAMIDELTERKLQPEENDYKSVLVGLIEQYESETFEIPRVSDGEIISFLLESHGKTQRELAHGTKIPESTISEFLKGKRKLGREHIGKIASYFHVEPWVFSFAV